MIVKLDSDDVVIEHADSEELIGRCNPGEYIVEILDRRTVTVGEVLPPPAQIEGQISVFDEA